MPLNEDELRNVFESVALPIIMNGGIKGKWLLRTDLGDYKIDEIEDLWGSFKAAYSPEVLQALNVAVVPTEPTDDMVIAFAEEWFCQKQAIDDVKMDEAYQAMLASSPYAITPAA